VNLAGARRWRHAHQHGLDDIAQIRSSAIQRWLGLRHPEPTLLRGVREFI
jgi:hypothetical protein